MNGWITICVATTLVACGAGDTDTAETAAAPDTSHDDPSTQSGSIATPPANERRLPTLPDAAALAEDTDAASTSDPNDAALSDDASTLTVDDAGTFESDAAVTDSGALVFDSGFVAYSKVPECDTYLASLPPPPAGTTRSCGPLVGHARVTRTLWEGLAGSKESSNCPAPRVNLGRSYAGKVCCALNDTIGDVQASPGILVLESLESDDTKSTITIVFGPNETYRFSLPARLETQTASVAAGNDSTTGLLQPGALPGPSASFDKNFFHAAVEHSRARYLGSELPHERSVFPGHPMVGKTRSAAFAYDGATHTVSATIATSVTSRGANDPDGCAINGAETPYSTTASHATLTFTGTAILGAAPPATAPPANPHQTTYVTSPSGLKDRFGFSVAIDGDTMVVGAPDERRTEPSTGGGTYTYRGGAYVFLRTATGWTQQAHLQQNGHGDLGSSVAIVGDTVALGSYSIDNYNEGAVFTRSAGSWTLTRTVKNYSKGAGKSIAMSSNGTILFGAPDQSNSKSYAPYDSASGQAEVRSVPGMQTAITLVSPRVNDYAVFGTSVAASNSWVFVGAPGDDGGDYWSGPERTASFLASLNDSGVVYAYDTTEYNTSYYYSPSLIRLRGSHQRSGDRIGNAIASSADTLAVVGKDPQTAYVFRRYGKTWVEQQTLPIPWWVAGGAASIAIDGDTIVVGAPNESSGSTTTTSGAQVPSDATAAKSGAAFLFRRSGFEWALSGYLKAANANAGDGFGSSVSVSGHTIVVGTKSGAVYVYDF